jgi:hypothetical protein
MTRGRTYLLMAAIGVAAMALVGVLNAARMGSLSLGEPLRKTVTAVSRAQPHALCT